jgi:type IV secretion system protein VirB9
MSVRDPSHHPPLASRDGRHYFALLFAAFTLLIATPLAAQIRPEPGTGDPRHQIVTYDENQVTLVQAAPGFQVTIQFAPDELIENVAVGDSGAWQVTPNRRGDVLFVKPIMPGTATNMTVVTSVRLYIFDLKPLLNPIPDMAYTLRFSYPGEKEAADSSSPADLGRYQLSGDRALRPSAISDDGRHTYIQWATAQDLPAVYSVDEDGKESLVNGMMREGIFVIDSVEQRLAFRIDRQVARAARVATGDRK